MCYEVRSTSIRTLIAHYTNTRSTQTESEVTNFLFPPSGKIVFPSLCGASDLQITGDYTALISKQALPFFTTFTCSQLFLKLARIDSGSEPKITARTCGDVRNIPYYSLRLHHSMIEISAVSISDG